MLRRMKWMRLGGVVMLVLGVVIVLYLTLRQTGGTKPAASASADASGEELGAPAREAVRSSPRAAKQHVERQNCLASCASTRRTCEATADGEEAEQRCRDEASACQQECP